MPEFSIAETSIGAVRGLSRNGVTVFRGVPYGAPPVGELRFAGPIPCAPWRGIRDATRDGPIPPQTASRLAGVMGDQEARDQDEDCLTLTIATPAPQGTKRPVMVFLHGGAWMTGAGSLDWHDGTTLVREGDIVVVLVNYRLGALGYLSCPGISEGNFGTRDQIAALTWVRDNIAAFGGDPERITLAGQSAGATSIGRLLLDDDACPLFAQVILQSGGFGRVPTSFANAAKHGARFCELLGIDPEESGAAPALRAMPSAQILAAQDRLAQENARFGDTAPAFVPTVDGMAGATDLIEAVAARATGKRFLLGANRDECHAFFALNPAMQNPEPRAVADHFAKLAGSADAMDRYRARRPNGSVMDLMADVASDHTFIWPTMRLAETLAARNVETYAYRFSWSPPGSPFRACHTIELPFLFGCFAAWRQAPMLAGADAAEMEALSAAMRADWIRFIQGERPDPRWPPYEAGRRATMVFDNVIEIAGDPHGLGWRAC